MIRIEDIIEIRKAKIYDRGYEIVFPDDKIIWLTKRRTIAGLLLLIKYETCSEEDLVGANNRLQEIKQSSAIQPHTFAKDRVSLEFDHRIPVDRGGDSSIDNYQALQKLYQHLQIYQLFQFGYVYHHLP